MLNGIRVFSNNPVWRHILSELGATVVDVPSVLDVNLDKIPIDGAITPDELKSIIVQHADHTKILESVFGKNVPQLSDMQQCVIVSLVCSGGMTGSELKNNLAHMPVATHTIDNAIYELRKLYGRDFILLENGVYKIGTV